jgi:hypothetical protein
MKGNVEEEKLELVIAGIMEILDLSQAENLTNLKDPQVSLMKINSIFCYVEPEELLRNN